jgi:hypothetical protein
MGGIIEGRLVLVACTTKTRGAAGKFRSRPLCLRGSVTTTKKGFRLSQLPPKLHSRGKGKALHCAAGHLKKKRKIGCAIVFTSQRKKEGVGERT